MQKNQIHVIWSIVSGIVLYGLIRLIFRKRMAALLKPFVKNINLDLVDEISYRSVLIGFPVFTLGCLNFCDDLGTNCLDTILGMGSKRSMGINYLAVLCSFSSLSISKGWHGEKSAWLAVVGFVIIMFNLIAVNLVLAGLHSYAGS